MVCFGIFGKIPIVSRLITPYLNEAALAASSQSIFQTVTKRIPFISNVYPLLSFFGTLALCIHQIFCVSCFILVVLNGYYEYRIWAVKSRR